MADCASLQVMMEAGRDAVQEAPNIFAAMDALATRAASFAERRQRALQERQVAGAEAVSPRCAATAAARSIKQVNAFFSIDDEDLGQAYTALTPLLSRSCMPI